MCGEDVNDAPVIAAADIGFTFKNTADQHSIDACNVITKKHDISALLSLKQKAKQLPSNEESSPSFHYHQMLQSILS